MQAIPTTVVTGFLGAGKTTLIRHMIGRADGLRIALIVNEFGDLGVDGETLRGCGDPTCEDGPEGAPLADDPHSAALADGPRGAALAGDDIVELSNGCLCCTVAEDFVPTIEALLARETPPDHIVVETSGLALPQPLLRAFAWPAIRGRVTVDGVVAVVDGPALEEGRFAHDPEAVNRQRAADDGLDHETPLAELYEDQVASADLIVVNKADLLSDPSALVARVEGAARPGVSVLPASEGRLPLSVLLGRGMAAEDDAEAREAPHHHHHDDHDDHGEDDHHHEHGHEHGHDEFESFVLERGPVADPAAFARRLSETMTAHGILRAKGFARVEGRPMRLALQAVGPRVDHRFDRPVSASDPEGARIVVIGRAGMDRAGIEAALG